jgi:DNA phosphorothioation-associated putative methyltransferase
MGYLLLVKCQYTVPPGPSVSETERWARLALPVIISHRNPATRGATNGSVSEECSQARLGKLTPDSLYVHVAAVNELPLLLRAFEGCARTLLGDIPQATLVKLRRDKPRVSYLCYPTFDTEAHPPLTETFVVDLRRQCTSHYDYTGRENPPVLHRKELLVATDYPLRSLFASLTSAEVEAGLFEDASGIGTRQAWEARLASVKCVIEGHELRRPVDA